MADIELVIKISEEQYEMIQNISNFISADATQIIRNGILLPKGHGRLIDESKIKNCGWNFIDHHAKTDAPTIIEADKAESDDDHMTADELAELFTKNERTRRIRNDKRRSI